MFELFHSWNVRVRLPKDQPSAFDEDPCSLMQHYLAVCIDETEDEPCVDQRGVDVTVVPHLHNWRNPLHFTVSNQYDRMQDRGGDVRRLTDGP